MTALEVHSLVKTFGALCAVDDVSFDVGEGEIVGLLGPNGAGKSTLVHMALGLIAPDSGRVKFFGKDLRREREEILGRVNFLSPYVGFPTRLTVFENLAVYAGLYRVPKPRAKIVRLLETFGIAELCARPLVGLSSGELARVGLCKVFLNDPQLLILDEPLANLDPHAAAQVQSMIEERQRRDGLAILLTSHNMRQVEALCGRVIFLQQGRVTATGTPLEVTRALLKEERDDPDLLQAFLAVGERARRAPA
jgi:ABC-2 type transport system ATP-binding protein